MYSYTNKREQHMLGYEDCGFDEATFMMCQFRWPLTGAH